MIERVGLQECALAPLAPQQSRHKAQKSRPRGKFQNAPEDPFSHEIFEKDIARHHHQHRTLRDGDGREMINVTSDMCSRQPDLHLSKSCRPFQPSHLPSTIQRNRRVHSL